jgi:hypothetical protein
MLGGRGGGGATAEMREPDYAVNESAAPAAKRPAVAAGAGKKSSGLDDLDDDIPF